MYSIHNKEKSVVAEILKHKIFKHMTAISKNIYFALDYICKYKNIFAKGCTPNQSEEVFVVNKIENTVPWTHVINDLNGEEIRGTLYEKELQKIDQK